MTTPTAYDVLAEWLAAEDAELSPTFYARVHAAWAAARACVARGEVAVPAYMFQEYCACGGFAAGMNGRDLKQPHLDWCPQLPEWLAYRAAIDAATKENAK